MTRNLFAAFSGRCKINFNHASGYPEILPPFSAGSRLPTGGGQSACA